MTADRAQITDRAQMLMQQMEAEDVCGQLAFDCLRSSHLCEQALAYEVFTSRFRPHVMPYVPTGTDVPMLLLEYMLRCVVEDVSDEGCDGLIHTKGEAFLELRVPLAEYWEKYGCVLDEDRYFERLAEFLKSTDYHGELATHTLEAFSPRERPFLNAMKAWKRDPVLSRYVAELEEIFGGAF